MTIDEAIKHCEEEAEKYMEYGIETECYQCGKDHEQLASWLKELKERRAADVKRGYWKDIMMSEATGWDLSLTGGRDDVLETVCSVCGDCCAFDGDGEPYLSSYCPNCGSDMQTE